MKLVPGLAQVEEHFLYHCVRIGGLQNAAGGAGGLRAELDGVVNVLAVRDACALQNHNVGIDVAHGFDGFPFRSDWSALQR